MRLNYREKTEGCWRGGQWRDGLYKWVMGVNEGMCRDEHWVFYISDELLDLTPETNNTLYVKFK